MRIALVSEGTYPFAMGGVSVWCDQIIRGLTDHEWEIIALTVDETPPVVWAPPANLVGVRTVPLWSPPPRTRRRHPDDDLLEAWDRLCVVLCRSASLHPEEAAEDRRRAARALELLRVAGGPAARAGTEMGLADDVAVTVLLDRWREHQPRTPLSVHDALSTADLLEHLLRPLLLPPVQADVVHASMNGPSALVGMAAAWADGTPFVLSEHGIYLRERYLLHEGTLSPTEHYLRLAFFRAVAGAAYLCADAIAPHSLYNRRWQLRNGAAETRVRTMYNGVRVEDFPPATDEPSAPTISYLGRIDPIKDIVTLVRAFALVRREIPTARLRVFGAPPRGQEPYLALCREIVSSLGVADAVRFEGATDHPVSAYHGGSLVALTSISEGFPFTVVEAMACGRPVVCTNVGGVSEAVGDGGVVVDPRDPEAFAAACITLLSDPVLRHEVGARARARVQEWFTERRWVDAYAELYADVASPEGVAAPPRTRTTAVPVVDPTVSPADAPGILEVTA